MLKDFTIFRPDWLIPEQADESSCLLSAATGNKCCLGMYALQAGIKKDRLFLGSPEDLFGCETNRRTINSLAEKFGLIVTKDEEGYFENSNITKTIMSINDTPVGEKFFRFNREGAKIKSLAHREKLIATEFAKIGVKVSFVGEYKLNG